MESNFAVVFNNKRFPVNREVFAEMSTRFASSAQGRQVLDMSDVVRESSFVEFLNCCQRQAYSINIDNAHDLYYLAKKWNVDYIKEDFEKLKTNLRREDLALSKVITCARTGKKYTKDLPVVAKNFAHYIETRQAFSLPVHLLAEIIRNWSFECDQSVLFGFLVTQFERNQEFGALFKYLKTGALTVSEIEWLEAHPAIEHAPLSAKHQESLVSVRDEVAKQQDIIDKLINKSKEDSPLESIKHTIREMKRELRKRCQPAEPDTPSPILEQFDAVKKQLDDLEQRIAAESEEALFLEERNEDILYDLGSTRKRIQGLGQSE